MIIGSAVHRDPMLSCHYQEMPGSARLLASSAKESGAWLEALSISSLSLCMEDKLSGWQLVCAWVPPFLVPTPAVTVGRKSTPWQHMSLAVDKARDATMQR